MTSLSVTLTRFPTPLTNTFHYWAQLWYINDGIFRSGQYCNKSLIRLLNRPGQYVHLQTDRFKVNKGIYYSFKTFPRF